MTGKNKGKIFITTPGGNIGGQVASLLRKQDVELSVLSRAGGVGSIDPDVLKGAELHIGAMDDAAILIEASKNAAAMLLVLPTDPFSESLPGLWRSITHAAVKAVRANGIPNVVLISSQGADVGGCELLDALLEAEGELGEVTPNLRILRPGFFMENLLSEAVALIEGVLPMSVGADTELRMVATRDVAAVAATLLGDLSWEGHEALALYGPETLSPVAVAEIISQVAELPVAFVPISPEEFLTVLLEAGFSAGTAEPTVKLFSAFASNRVPSGTPVEERILPTGLREFTADRLVPELKKLASPLPIVVAE